MLNLLKKILLLSMAYLEGKKGSDVFDAVLMSTFAAASSFLTPIVFVDVIFFDGWLIKVGWGKSFSLSILAIIFFSVFVVHKKNGADLSASLRNMGAENRLSAARKFELYFGFSVVSPIILAIVVLAIR